MSKIDELIAKYCPNGVEYKELGKVCKFQRGNSITQNDVTEGDVPVIAGGQKPSYYHNKSNRTGETIAVSSSGAYAGFVSYWTIPVFLSDSFSVNPDMELLTPKYVYYFLKHNQEKIHNTKRGSGVPHVHGSSIAKLLIPIPPLPVQQEIVNILDKFTELEKELEKELEEELKARHKQYKYYRNRLLSATEVNGKWLMNGVEVEWKTLGELGIFYGGLSGKTKADFQDGNAKYISYMNVYSNIAINTNINDFVRIGENENQNRVEYGDVLFTGSSETPDECGISSVLTEKISEPLYLNSFCFGFRLHDKNLFLPDFLKYLFRDDIIRKQIARTANGVTRFNVSKKLFAKILIPIPPLSEQERIVEILDKFDSLVNDISISLPAEIEARRKQYEYYRSKLLCFKPK